MKTSKMRYFFLIALTAGLLSPAAANAESVWLVLAGGRGSSAGNSAEMVKIEMSDISSCKRQGEELKQSKEFRVGVFDAVNYFCVVGK